MQTPPTPPVCNYEGSDYQTSFWDKGGRAYEDGCEAVALKRLLHSVGKNQPPSGGSSKPTECSHLLELGAGAGRNTPRYSGYGKVTLLDYSVTQLSQARARLGSSDRSQLNQTDMKLGTKTMYRYVAADIYRLPFVEGVFDGATMIRTLHHMVEAPRALEQVRRVLAPDATFILEYANKRNIKSILRYWLGKQKWSPFTPEPVEYIPLNFDFHPRTIRQWMAEAGFSIERTLTVSHLRLGLLKRLLPTRLLVWLDSLFSLTGDWWQLTPSVFLAARASASGEAAAEGGFFACPACGNPLADTPPLLRCTACGREYPVIDGIYDLRVDPPAWAE